MVDCSHGNSLKNHHNQAAVVILSPSRLPQGPADHWRNGGSHLVGGRQDYLPGKPSVYGQASPMRASHSIKPSRCSSSSRASRKTLSGWWPAARQSWLTIGTLRGVTLAFGSMLIGWLPAAPLAAPIVCGVGMMA